jgi:hypothetical protein
MCVLALDIRHADRIYYAPRAILSSVFCLIVAYFFLKKFSYAARFSKNEVILRKMCASIFSKIFYLQNFSFKENSACVCIFMQSTR